MQQDRSVRPKNRGVVVLLALYASFSLFQKGEFERRLDRDAAEDEKERREKRVRCPACKWQPSVSSRWYCGDCPHPEGFFGGCGAFWNTFETNGVCPGCKHQWRWTVCLRCLQWALHDDWYVDDDSRES